MNSNYKIRYRSRNEKDEISMVEVYDGDKIFRWCEIRPNIVTQFIRYYIEDELGYADGYFRKASNKRIQSVLAFIKTLN